MKTCTQVLCFAVMALLAVGAAAQSDVDAKRDLFNQNGSPTPQLENGPPLIEGSACHTEAAAPYMSWDFLGDPNNDVVNVDILAAGCTDVSDVGWVNITVTTFAPSWADEVFAQFSASDNSGAAAVQFFPGLATTITSSVAADGSVGGPIPLLGDNILRMEFYETGFNDFSGSPDASYPSGEIEAIGVIIPVELTGFEIE